MVASCCIYLWKSVQRNQIACKQGRRALFYKVLPVKLDQFISNVRFIPENLASKVLGLNMVNNCTFIDYEP